MGNSIRGRPNHWVLKPQTESMAVCQGMRVLRPPSLSIPASLSLSLFSRPSCMEQRGDAHEEGSWARRRISLGATDPIMRAKHFSFCITLPALPSPFQQRPALSMSRSEIWRRGEWDGGAYRTKPKHIVNHLSSSPSTCFAYWNYNKT